MAPIVIGPEDPPFRVTSQDGLNENPSLFPPRKRLQATGLTTNAEGVAEEQPLAAVTLILPPIAPNKTEMVLEVRVLEVETSEAPEGMIQLYELAVPLVMFTENTAPPFVQKVEGPLILPITIGPEPAPAKSTSQDTAELYPSLNPPKYCALAEMKPSQKKLSIAYFNTFGSIAEN